MANARRESVDMRGFLVARPDERAIADLAGRRHGVVTREELRQLGFRESAIDRRVAAGRLHRLHRGVYAVGHDVVTRRGRWLAAVLACGPGAALSHASAAALWEIGRADPRRVVVSVPTAGGRARTRVAIRRTTDLRPEETTVRHGIPVTTATRTALDLAATLGRAHLEKLLDEIEIRELTDYPALRAIAAAHPGHRGAAHLRDTLATHHAGRDVTRSGLEILFLEICEAHGLPRPGVNRQVAGRTVDFVFPDARLVVETDSWRYHRTRRAFEDDRARDALLARAGYRTLRFTDHHLEVEPAVVAATIAGLVRTRET
jgi:predicted transcriptional regulator of viral defense system